jgi:phosphate transport system permease protein
VNRDTTVAPSPPGGAGRTMRRRAPRRKTSLFANGEPLIWMTGAALILAFLMIVGLLWLVLHYGSGTFWPEPVVRIETTGGRTWMGEVTREDRFRPEESRLESLEPAAAEKAKALVARNDGWSDRRLVRIGNFEFTGEHFQWVSDFELGSESRPEWAVVVERMAWGRFYGFPKRFLEDGKVVAEEPAAVWRLFEEHHDAARDRFREQKGLETHEMGAIRERMREGSLRTALAAHQHGKGSREHEAAKAEFARAETELAREREAIQSRMDALAGEGRRRVLVLETADGKEKDFFLGEIVRAYTPNRMGFLGSLGVYLSRWREFLLDDPREVNTEGGVYPAIFGTVTMTMIMALLVVPFGVLAALFLREYAKAGLMVSMVRIAVNNLAGVPSIVFGVFGLGFFCYFLGAGIDDLFFSAEKVVNNQPTFGTGGLLWASLTLALLTLPVVIVATEEALAAVPRSMREGSYACGASKWQTIQRIVLPRAMPGIMTGMILAIARGAGEVAPLMLVGAVKLAPNLPVDGDFPFLHPQRSFMHLGFHIYDLGFQSPNSEAAKPMVYTTTLLLIAIIVALNLLAIWIRARLRRRFLSGQV